MDKMKRIFWAFALTVSTCQTAPASPLISPGAGSEAVLAMRAASQDQLQLTYNVEHPSSGVVRVTFGLSPDYSFKQSPSEGLSIRDYRLKRLFRIDPTGAFTNDSLYAEAWYRGAELENRANINAAFAKAGVDINTKSILPQQPFWAESQLGVTTPKFPRPAIERHVSQNETTWTVGPDRVVSVRYSDEPVPTEIRKGLRRWWPSLADIHPAIADELAEAGKVPAEVWVMEIVGGKALETVHWTLIQARYFKATQYPLAAGLAAVATEKRGAYPELFHLLSTEVTTKRMPPPQSDYETYAKAAMAKSAGLEAFLWTIESKLAGGASGSCSTLPETEYCALVTQAGALAKSDPRTAIAFAPHSPDAGDRAQFDSLPNAYFLRLLWATRPPGKDVKPEDSEKDLVAALTARPLANFCKDAGDFYAQRWSPFAAWQTYDFGRLMGNHRSDDLLSNVDKLEATLTTAFPSLF